jgi:hypothetical protein
MTWALDVWTLPTSQPQSLVQLRFEAPRLEDSTLSQLSTNGSRVALRNSHVAASFLPPFFTSTRLDIMAVELVQKVANCGDRTCVAEELRVEGAPVLPTTCDQDCPLAIGASCPMPGSVEVGDPEEVSLLEAAR